MMRRRHWKYLDTQKAPIVIMRRTRLGKGVIIAQTIEEAKAAVNSMMADKSSARQAILS